MRVRALTNEWATAAPDHPVARALTRILDPGGRHVGFGLLVAPGRVVTCAHVVAESMGELPSLADPPARGRVRLDFPFAAPGRVLTAAVVAWRAMGEDGSGDVAGLELDDEVPAGVQAHPMARGGHVQGHRFLAYGHQDPGSGTVPTWVPGRIVEEARQGWLQLGVHEHTGGLRIRQGFSGSPVWDVQNGQIIGLVTQAYLRSDMWLAYATTGQTVFDAWPDLRDIFQRACPFRMLVPFEAVDRELFFGRDELAAVAVDRITRHEHTLVTGASGAGKTSLFRAVVMPELERRGHIALPVRLSRDSLWGSIAAAVAERRYPGEKAKERYPGERAEEMEAERRIAEELSAGGARRLGELLGSDQVVVLIDQFEEELHVEDAPTRGLVAELGRLPSVRRREGGPLVRVVIIMREDKRAGLLELFPSKETPPAEIQVGPLTADQLRASVEEPIRRTGFVCYEDRLVDRIIDEVNVQPYSLPTLQVVLTELWKRQTPDGLLRHSVYQELNQGAGPLSTHLERTWHSIDNRRRAAARRLFLQLVVPLEGGTFGRRVVARSEVDPDTWSAVDALAGHRLVVLRGTALGEATAELVHDALIEQWPTLAEHLAANRELLRWRDDMRRLIAAWRQSREQTGHLLHGAALSQGLRRMREQSAELSPPEREFLTASRDNRAKRRRLSALTLTTVAALLIGLGWFALTQNNAASQKERQDLSRRLATQSGTLTKSDPILSALLAAAAWKSAETPEARYSMLAVQHSPNRATLADAIGTTYSGAFSPDGRTLATGGGRNDESVRLWEVRTHKQIGRVAHLGGSIWSVVYSPDGRQLAAGSGENKVVLVDTATRHERELLGHAEGVEDVVFSPDGRLLASAGGDVRVWDAATGRQVIPALTHPANLTQVAFSPAGDRLVTGGRDGVVRFWTLSGKPVDTITAAAGSPKVEDDALQSVEFSPDGRTLATSDARQRIRFWDVASLQPISDSPTGSLAVFSPDGRILAYTVDKAVKLWDVAGRRQIGAPLTGHTGDVKGISFSPDGNSLATTSVDATVRLWDISAYRSVGTPLTVASGTYAAGSAASASVAPGGVERLAFSSDGRTLATGGFDLRLWDVASRTQMGAPLTAFDNGDGSHNTASDVAFSLDGRYLAASGSGLRPAQVWDLSGKAPIPRKLTDGTKELSISALTFAPDGLHLITIDNNGPVRIWETASLRLVATIPDSIGDVNDIAISPDGKLLATADSAHLTIRLWDLAKRQVVGSINTGHTKYVYTVAFDPRGSLLASSGLDPTPRMWDVASRLPVGTPLEGHSDYLGAIAFSPDGRTLVTGSGDHTARLWDVDTRRQVGDPLTGHAGAVRSIAFRLDGKLMATGSEDGTVRFWDMTPAADLTASMCTIAGRPLTDAEWHRYTSGQELPSVCR